MKKPMARQRAFAGRAGQYMPQTVPRFVREQTIRKCSAALKNSMQPIVCSQTEADEKAGKYEYRIYGEPTFVQQYRRVEAGWRSDTGFYTKDSE